MTEQQRMHWLFQTKTTSPQPRTVLKQNYTFFIQLLIDLDSTFGQIYSSGIQSFFEKAAFERKLKVAANERNWCKKSGPSVFYHLLNLTSRLPIPTVMI